MEVKSTSRILVCLIVTDKDSIGESERAEFIQVEEYQHDFKGKSLDFGTVFDAVADMHDYIPRDEAYEFVSENPPERDGEED